MKKVVWLASWYPNDADPFTGDFIQRHARATAPFQPIALLFIGKRPDRSLSGPNPAETIAGLAEYRLYYNVNGQPGIAARFAAARLYARCFNDWFRRYRNVNGLPDLIHVHVAMRAGLIALYLKKRFGIPYLLTEHWTGYFDNSAHPVSAKGPVYRYLLKKILRNAALITPVSADLGGRICSSFGDMPVKVIPNVVDTRLFFLKTETGDVFRFIHVSSMTAVKNAAGILRAFCSMIDTGVDAELVMIGPAENLDPGNLQCREKIRFTGEISYREVAHELRKANAFLLFSDRENQPCVVLESLCCGVPVIATRTGGIPEVVDESNGILVEPGDEPGLVSAMKKMISGFSGYDLPAISLKASSQFGYATVGKEYANCYRTIPADK